MNPTRRRTRTIYLTQKSGQIRMLLLEKNLPFVSFQHPSISISLFQAGRHGCLFSRYLVEWQRVWLISCCWRPGPMKGSKKKKKGLSLSESSHGSCSFFAWLALREAGYLADDKCSCTPSCLKTPPDAKPWQPVRLPPLPHPPAPSPGPSTSACPPARRISGSRSLPRSVAALAECCKQKSLLG